MTSQKPREILMQDDRTIPYTYWAYVSERREAEKCGAALGAECLVGVESAVEPVEGLPWLLRAARDVPLAQMEEIDAAVVSAVALHGGFFDGGETGWFSLATGDYVRQSTV